MTAQERQVVENKISELKKELNEVHGSKCEVYSRVVGYLRPKKRMPSCSCRLMSCSLRQYSGLKVWLLQKVHPP